MLGLVFDFDGLILDTETPELTVWTDVFREHGAELSLDYWTGHIGRGAEQEFERPAELLKRLTSVEVDLETVRVRIRAMIDRQPVLPGVVSLLEDASQHGVPVAIASSSKHIWVDKYLEKLGLLDRFPVICCADDVARAKPFPDLYVLACQRLGVPVGSAVALEDSPNGIAAANAAGIFVVAVPNPVTSLLDLSQADATVASLEEVSIDGLTDWLKPKCL